MKEKQKITYYPNKNKKTETYIDGDTFVTKHFHNEKDAYVKERINLKGGVKEVKHFTNKGILSKLGYYVEDKRHGVETKYSVPKANESVKSTKTYSDGKLHGEAITYNDDKEIIKHELFALGKLTLKYLHKNSSDISGVQIIDKDNIDNLPKEEYDKLQEYMEKHPERV